MRRVPTLERNDPMHWYILGTNCWEAASWKKSWVVVDVKLKMSQLCTLEAKEVSSIPGCVSLNVARRSREGPFPSALGGSHLEHWIQFWASQYRRVMDILDWAWCRVFNVMEGLSVREESLSELDCLTGRREGLGWGQRESYPCVQIHLDGKDSRRLCWSQWCQIKVKGHTWKYRKFN